MTRVQPKILLWGARSQARIVQALLAESDLEPSFLFDPALEAPSFKSPARFTNRIDELSSMIAQADAFIVCIGGARGVDRVAISEALRDRGSLAPLSVISRNALIDPEVEIGAGAQILPGSCIRIGARLGAFVIVNTSATIDHECQIHTGVHVMGSAALAGLVEVGTSATIGTNATILPSVRIGQGSFVGAGAVVPGDVEANHIVAGVPAKILRLHEPEPDLSVIEALNF